MGASDGARKGATKLTLLRILEGGLRAGISTGAALGGMKK